MAVLITGGSGLVGLELGRTMARKGRKVILFDVVPPEKGDTGGATFVKGNIADWPEVLNAVRDGKVTRIFHLAAMLSAQCEANPWAAMQVNASGMYNILEASRLFGVKQVVFASSQGIFGAGIPDGVAYDDTPPKPRIIYGVTKIFGEHLGRYYQNKFGLDFRGVRYAQVMGVGIKSQGYSQFYPRMIESAIKGIHFEVQVPEDTSVPLIYVKDAVRFLIELSEANEDRIKTRVYNGGQILPAPSAGDLAKEVKRQIPGAQITFKPDQAAINGIAGLPRLLDDAGARTEWNWSFRYGLKEMVEDFIKESRS